MADPARVWDTCAFLILFGTMVDMSDMSDQHAGESYVITNTLVTLQHNVSREHRYGYQCNSSLRCMLGGSLSFKMVGMSHK